jgi:hypothetical protein
VGQDLDESDIIQLSDSTGTDRTFSGVIQFEI